MLWLCAVFGALFFAVGAHGQKRIVTACYAATNCQQMNLNCSNSKRIFIFRMLYGKKTMMTNCPEQPSCNSSCCQLSLSDCFLNYSIANFESLYTEARCWNRSSCLSRAGRSYVMCSKSSDYSSYVVADYNCLGSEDITDFHCNATITAPAVAIQYNSGDVTGYAIADTDSFKTWHCQVDTADCVPRKADVMLVKANGTFGNCSAVGWSKGSVFDCAQNFSYLSINVSTPFRVSVQVNKNGRNPNGWAVVRAQDGSNLSVTCGFNEPAEIQPCSATTTTIRETMTTTTSTTTTIMTSPVPTGNAQTTPTQESLRTTRTPSSTASAPATTAIMSSASVSSTSQNPTSLPDRSQTYQPVNKTDNSSNTGAIAGGAVAAAVVLVAVFLGLFCYFRKRRHNPEEEVKPRSKAKSSMHMPLTSVTSGSPASSRASESGIPNNIDVNDGDYDRIGHIHEPLNGLTTTPGPSGKPRSPVKDPDYDLLGQKKPQSSSSNPAATYGRLGEVGGGGEDTDYSYDHLARGHQAAPDVINSDYDTAALHVTSEGDYNVAGIPKKQHVITGSDYDVAQIVTSEGDYNKVNFQGKKQRVIMGSDYDTAEIVTSDGDYNRVDFQGKKQKVVTGSDYDRAEIMTSDDTESADVSPGTSTRIKVGGGNYTLAKPILK